ncbi:MAG TPA: hypothetical protein VLJ38_10405 [Polyangiaceae bacterium]|nr:hypothetical protein [Polyangiaceae bacterium]
MSAISGDVNLAGKTVPKSQGWVSDDSDERAATARDDCPLAYLAVFCAPGEFVGGSAAGRC